MNSDLSINIPLVYKPPLHNADMPAWRALGARLAAESDSRDGVSGGSRFQVASGRCRCPARVSGASSCLGDPSGRLACRRVPNGRGWPLSFVPLLDTFVDAWRWMRLAEDSADLTRSAASARPHAPPATSSTSPSPASFRSASTSSFWLRRGRPNRMSRRTGNCLDRVAGGNESVNGAVNAREPKHPQMTRETAATSTF